MADEDDGVSKLAYLSSVDKHWETENYVMGTFIENSQVGVHAFVDGLTRAEASELREAFSLFDRNGDDTICKDELGPVLRALGRNPTHQDIENMMKEADTDNSGNLNFEEYAQVISKHLTPLEEVKAGLRQAFQVFDKDKSGYLNISELQEAFQVFDKDKSGYLNISELQEVLCSIGDALTSKEAQLVLEAVDVNKDGQVDVEEFVAFLCDKV